MQRQELDKQLEISIKELCEGVAKFIIKDKSNIHSLVIQYKNDHIFVGRSSGNFQPDFYNELAKDGIVSSNKDLADFIKKTGGCVASCYRHIIDKTEYKKIKGFNIRYSMKTGEINITLNRMGAVSIEASRIFKQFK